MPQKTTLKQFQDIVMSRVRRRVRPRLIGNAFARFQIAKKKLLEDIRNHPISQELIHHNNPSRFLSGKGTLFGFLGFPANSNPVGELVAVVNDSIRFYPGNQWRNNILPVYIEMLTADELELTKLPWTSASWAYVIENQDISGLLTHFLSAGIKPIGRSDEGIQVKGQVTNAAFNKVPFLTPLFKEFRQNLVTLPL